MAAFARSLGLDPSGLTVRDGEDLAGYELAAEAARRRWVPGRLPGIEPPDEE